MMTLADLLKEFIDSSKERLKTPISGAFLWSFIIWNWRPIVELCFSKASIEERIYIINVEYCNIWSVLGPLALAFSYTIAVPMIMVKIDRLLIKTKKARVDNIFESKEHTIDKKIKLAKKEFELKNVESGNKQIEDFQRQIKGLEDSKNEIVKSNETTISQLKKQLKESTETIKNFLKTDSNIKLYNSFKKQLNTKDWSDVDLLINAVHSERDIHKTILGLNEGLVKKLFDNDYIEVKNEKYILTQSGKDLLELM